MRLFKYLFLISLAFYCSTGEIIQVGDTIGRLENNSCYPYYKYGERYYNEHWMYEGKNGFNYEVTIKRGEVITITNEGK